MSSWHLTGSWVQYLQPQDWPCAHLDQALMARRGVREGTWQEVQAGWALGSASPCPQCKPGGRWRRSCVPGQGHRNARTLGASQDPPGLWISVILTLVRCPVGTGRGCPGQTCPEVAQVEGELVPAPSHPPRSHAGLLGRHRPGQGGLKQPARGQGHGAWGATPSEYSRSGRSRVESRRVAVSVDACEGGRHNPACELILRSESLKPPPVWAAPDCQHILAQGSRGAWAGAQSVGDYFLPSQG